MIEKLPGLPPSREQLSEIVQECLNGSAVVSRAAAYTSCLDCGNPSEYFQQEVVDDEGYQILITSCPACGWIQGMGAHGKEKPHGA